MDVSSLAIQVARNIKMLFLSSVRLSQTCCAAPAPYPPTCTHQSTTRCSASAVSRRDRRGHTHVQKGISSGARHCLPPWRPSIRIRSNSDGTNESGQGQPKLEGFLHIMSWRGPDTIELNAKTIQIPGSKKIARKAARHLPRTAMPCFR